MRDSGRFREMIRFAVAGGVGFLVEFAVLVLLREKAGMDTLIATPIAFLVSVVVNYLLCVRWVFHGVGQQNGLSRAGFLLTSAIGLGLNELLMLLFRVILGEDGVLLTISSFQVNTYMLNKVLATLIVMIWNYFTKRMILNRASRKEAGDREKQE